MSQPKKPPISLRLSDALLQEVDAWAKARELNRNAAIKALIDLGLGAPKPIQRAEKPKPAAPAKAKPEKKPKAEARPPRAYTLSGEPIY